MRPVRLYILTALAALAACGRAADAPATRGNDDPLVAAALADPIASDPELAAQNRANAAAALPAVDGSVPTLDISAQAIAAARADALAALGGPEEMRSAPAPRRIAVTLPARARLRIVALAAAAATLQDCAAKLEYTAAWAAKLPVAFPVYPRGAVQEAAGTEAAGCSLRAVKFQTPVPLGDVIDFYFSQARKAGFSATHVVEDGDDVLAGTRGTAGYTVHARHLPSGATEVDLITSR